MVSAIRTASRDPAKNAIFFATTVNSGERKQFIYLDAAWIKEKKDRKNKKKSLLVINQLCTLLAMDEKHLCKKLK